MENSQALMKDLFVFQNDFLYFQKHLSNLRKDYVNRFVALHNKKVIGAATSIEELKEDLSKKNFDISKVLVEFVPKEDTLMIL